jgi:Tol biopolymer transport system component
MSAVDRFEREITDALVDLAAPRMPDYIDTVLERAVSRRQRPAWTFPERWIPMTVITGRQRFAPALPWRTLALIALLLVMLLALVVVGAGALLHPQRPAPLFGVAANGGVAYVLEGDIYVADPVTGSSRLLIGGPTIDVWPEFSRDGRSLLFTRVFDPDTPNETVALMIANADGSSVRTLVASERPGEFNLLSPAGDMLALYNSAAEPPGMSIVNVATGARTHIDVPVRVTNFAWLPNGQEIVLRGIDDTGKPALYAMNVDGSNFRQVSDYIPGGFYNEVLAVSDNGRFVSYNARPGSHVFNLLDLQSGESRLQLPPLRAAEGHAVFSPDSQQVAFIRYIDGSGGTDAQAYIMSVDGASKDATPIGPTVTKRGAYQMILEPPQFSPDGKSLLLTSDKGESWLVDIATGEYQQTAWHLDDGIPNWQRVAP